jgi:hypothetical protein
VARVFAGEGPEPAARSNFELEDETETRGSAVAPADPPGRSHPAGFRSVSERATSERSEDDRTFRADFDRDSRPAPALAYEEDGDVPDPEPARPYQLREERRRSSASMFLWLVFALTLLLLAVVTMAIVLRRMGQQSKRLGGTVAEAHLAWR